MNPKIPLRPKPNNMPRKASPAKSTSMPFKRGGKKSK